MHQLKTGGDNKSLGFWQALAGPNQLLNLQPEIKTSGITPIKSSFLFTVEPQPFSLARRFVRQLRDKVSMGLKLLGG